MHSNCQLNEECNFNEACIDNLCKNPCICGKNALCSVINHKATCICPPNYSGYPEKQCIEENKCKDAKKYVNQCPGWAKNGQCEADPFNFMHTQCTKSCNLCSEGKVCKTVWRICNPSEKLIFHCQILISESHH